MKNSFDEFARSAYIYNHECWFCGRNTVDSLHHIMGRGKEQGDCERSIFNSAPLCNHRCHLKNHGLLRTEEWCKKLLKKTRKFLKESGYRILPVDERFLEKYKHLYQ